MVPFSLCCDPFDALSFQMSDAWLYSSPAFHPTPQAFCLRSTTPFINMNLNFPTVAVTAALFSSDSSKPSGALHADASILH